MSKLKIYKASAGSGKTFKLAEEYLNLVFKNPFNYRHILAVTFTNDATEEMKSRIIKEIYYLAKGHNSPYLKTLSNETGKSEEQIQFQAIDILNKILHDYSKFSIGTIDSFFQRIIRSFTREAGLQAGYTIELDQDTVLTEVVDNMIMDIENDNELRNWLVSFTQERVETGKNWNLEKDIIQLGNEVFKEVYKSFDKILLKKIQDKKFLESFMQELYDIQNKFEADLKKIATKSFEILKKFNLEIADFSYKEAGVLSFFIKIAANNFNPPAERPRNFCDNADKWRTKSSPLTTQITTAYHDGLHQNLSEAIAYYDQHCTTYNTANCVTNFIYTLGILTDLSKRLKEYADENNIFLISNAPKFLSEIIAGNDTPFIYEKTGTVYKHFMIDEFQDTSGMQWNNFKPLVCNSLASDFTSLIVGDVKQSIYRWRNGDWKLLGGRVEDDVEQFGSDKKNLSYNWRSHKNIIDFNNSIFNCASTKLQQQFNKSITSEKQVGISYLTTLLEDLYSDSYQLFPEKSININGFVNVKFFKQDTTAIPWKTAVLNDLPVVIEQLQEKGYRPKDIAILVRSKSEGKEITDFLIEYKNSSANSGNYCFDLISNEALYIKASPAVRLLVFLLRYFVNTHNKMIRTLIVNEYIRYIKNEGNSTDEIYNITSDELFFAQLPTSFCTEIETLKSLPVFELTESLIRIFSLNLLQKEIPFLQAFQQTTHDFGKNSSSDISSFLEWWDEKGISKTISVSGQQDAMRVLTIHKSKGLEFKAVIIPFCNWSLDHDTKKLNILWCSPQDAPFNQLDLVPVKYAKILASSLFYEAYYIEKMHAYIDNLNLLYVALTRAENAMFIYAPEPKRNEIATVADLLHSSIKNYAENKNCLKNKYIKLNEFINVELLQFQLGEISQPNKEKDKNPTSEKIHLKEYPSFDIQGKLCLKLHSRHFFDYEKHINYGTIIHDILKNIKTTSDKENALLSMIAEGRINSSEKENISKKIDSLFATQEAQEWFNGTWEVKNERAILMPDGKTKRPDRVMMKNGQTIVVDYKTGSWQKEHAEQVSEYISLLKEMGYADVCGYVWYLNSGKLQLLEN